ncbi:MAG: hypothetical protein Kow006_03740 [Gammaproteobacteria bacterium]
MAREVVSAIRSLLIPLEGEYLLVPNAAVAEILTYRESREVPESPEWFVGMLSWRNQTIPVISFEVVKGGRAPKVNPRSRLAVFNTVGANPAYLRFYAMVTQGFPSLINIDKSSIAPLEGERFDGVASQVLVAGRPASIPDLDYIEGRLVDRQQLGASAL